MKSFLRKLKRNYDVIVFFGFLGFQFINFLSFSPILTNDSGGYLELADILFTPLFFDEWNFHRTPLFPLSYYFLSKLIGDSVNSVHLTPFLYGIVGILFNYLSARLFFKSKFVSLLFLVFISIHPYTIIFQNTFLLESGIYAFLSAIFYYQILFLKTNRFKNLVFSAILIGFGYYLKSPILVLIVFQFLLVCFFVFKIWNSESTVRLVFRVLTIVCIPLLIIAPWKFHPIIKEREWKAGSIDILQGLLAQEVFVVDDDRVSDFKTNYLSAIQEKNLFQAQRPDGLLTTREFYPMLAALENHYKEKKSNMLFEFVSIVFKNPKNYFIGLKNNIILFSHLKEGDGGATMILGEFLAMEKAWVDIYHPDPVKMEALKSKYGIEITGNSAMKYYLRLGMIIFRILIPVSFFLLIPIFFWDIWKRNLISIYALAFLVFWILIFLLPLSGQERYIVPIHGFLFFVFFLKFDDIVFYLKVSRQIEK